MATTATIINIINIIIAILISWDVLTPSTQRGTRLNINPATTTAAQATP